MIDKDALIGLIRIRNILNGLRKSTIAVQNFRNCHFYFENNILAAIIVPVGIVLYLRMWRFRIRLYRDLNTIKQSNANIISQIKEM